MDQIGVEFIARDAGFQASIKQYNDSITKANQLTTQFAASSAKMGGSSKDASSGLSSLSNAAATAGKSVSGLGFGAMTAAVALGTTLANAIRSIVSEMASFAEAGIQSAARAQQLNYMLQELGARQGFTSTQIDKMTQSIMDNGITMTTAQTLMSQFIRYDLDLAKATDLARVAQDTATISGMSSSEELEHLIHGIQTQSSIVLRYAGITIDADQVQRDFAASIGKTKEQLTAAEKQQAVLNAVLADGTRNAGMYEASMKTVGKQWLSLRDREIPELLRVMSEPFLQGFFNIVKAAREVAQALKDAFDTGGPLRDVMINIGAAFALVTEKIGGFVTGITNLVLGMSKAAQTQQGFIDGVLGPIADFFGTSWEQISQLINNAAIWGENLVMAFANGMIAGFSAVVDAVGWLADFLTGQLEAHSPPKFLPDLDKWGAGAINAYLEGWKKADFGILKDVSKIIESVFKSSTDKDATDVIPAILGSRNAIAEAIENVNKLGVVTTGVIDKIVVESGIGSIAFRDYVTNMLNGELAAERLKNAQDELNTVTEFYDEQLKSLNAQLEKNSLKSVEEDQRLAEIQKAIATGLLTTEERQRLEAEKNDILLRRKIKSVEEEKAGAVSAAQEKVDAAQQEYDLIQARIDLAKEQIDLMNEQNSLVKQQIELLERLSKVQKVPKVSGIGAGGGAGLSEIALPEKGQTGIKVGSITDKLAEAIENTKNMLSEKLFGAESPFGQFIGRINKIIEDSGIVDKLSKLWDNVTKTFNDTIKELGKWWDKYGGDITEIVKDIKKAINDVSDWVDKNSIHIRRAISLILLFFAMIGKTITDFVGETLGAWKDLTHGDLEGYLKHMSNVWGLFVNLVNGLVSVGWEYLRGIFGGLFDTIGKWFTDLGKLVIGVWDGIKSTIGTALSGIAESITGWIIGKGTEFVIWWDTLKTNISTAIENTRQTIADKLAAISLNFTSWIDVGGAGYKINTWWTEFKKNVADMIEGARKAIADKLAEIGAAIQTAIDGSLGDLKEIFEGIGKAVGDAAFWVGELAGALLSLNISKLAELLGLGGGGGGEGLSGSRASGGLVSKRGIYELAENGPELVIPAELTKLLLGAMGSSYNKNLNISPGYSSNQTQNNYNNKHITIEVNPKYEHMQSPSAIRYDVAAALSAARI